MISSDKLKATEALLRSEKFLLIPVNEAASAEYWSIYSNMEIEKIIKFLECAKSYLLKNSSFGQYYPLCDKCQGTGADKKET